MRSGDWVEYGTGIGQPDVFDAALAGRVAELDEVKIRACLTLRPRAVLEADPGREHFHWLNWHYTGYDRAKADVGCANYIPCNLGEIPDYYRRFIDPPEIAVLKTCPKDEHGFYNFSLATVWHRAIVERARTVIVEESAGLPYLDGVENAVHESEVDYVIAGDGGPAPAIPNPPPTDADRAVAQLIAAEVEDGSCLQVGIGAMPNAVCSLLRESGVRDLGVHSGNVITTTRADMMYVVTEYGIVNLKGKSVPARARAMISIAHPDFRDDLDRDARAHGLIPKGVF